MSVDVQQNYLDTCSNEKSLHSESYFLFKSFSKGLVNPGTWKMLHKNKIILILRILSTVMSSVSICQNVGGSWFSQARIAISVVIIFFYFQFIILCR